MMKFGFLIWLTWNFGPTFGQKPDQIFIENFLANATKNLTNMETKVKQRANFLSLQVNYCISNLKASNVSGNFTEIFEKFIIKISEVQNTSNHKPLSFPLAFILTYDYTQYCIASLFADLGNFRSILTNLRMTSTVFYEFSKEISLQFQHHFQSLKSSKRLLVNQVLRQILTTIGSIRNYSLHLRVQIGNFMKLNAYLSNFIVSNAITAPPNATSDPYLSQMRAVESKLVSAQQQIILTSKIAKKKVSSAQKVIKFEFSKISRTLDGISSMNDYSLLGWPIFPDVKGGSSNLIMLRSSATSNLSPRAAFCELKAQIYDRIQKISLLNETMLVSEREMLNATNFEPKSTVILDVLTALLAVENAQKSYGSKLKTAKTEMKSLKENLLGITTTQTIQTTTAPSGVNNGDLNVVTTTEVLLTTSEAVPITTPLPTTTTAAPTTSTKPPTTTAFVTPPCGTFLPFNPLTDLALVSTYGVLAGTYSDGSSVYVGKGNNSAYLGLSSCPARISVDPLRPGAFMTSDSAEVLDNSTPYYLAKHANIVWGLVNEQTAWNYFYGLKMMAGNYPVMIGRVNISGVTYVGRVHYGNGLLGLHIFRPDLNQVVKLSPSDTFEVVGCLKANARCETTIAFDSTTNPFDKGLTAGVNFDGSLIYPTVAGLTFCPLLKNIQAYYVGRFTTGVGASIVCHNTTAGYEIKNSGVCALFQDTAAIAWKPTNLGSIGTLTGLITWSDKIQYAAFGRKWMGNWTMFGKVYYLAAAPMKGFYGWNTETNSLMKISSLTETFEVLTCV